MKLAIAAGALALALTACGGVGTGGAKAQMIKACMQDDSDFGDEKTCTCLADGLEKNLDAKSFSTVARAMSLGEDKGSEMLDNLPAEEQAKVMGALMMVTMSCAFGG